MGRKIIPVALCAVMLTTGIASAQSILEFDQWMQKIDKRSQSMQRNIAVKDANATVADAKEIEELYQRMGDYFAKVGNAADAVKLSQEGKELAVAVVNSATEQDFESAFKAATGITRACRTCHMGTSHSRHRANRHQVAPNSLPL